MKNETLSKIYVKLIIVLALIAGAIVLVWQKRIPLGLDLRGGSELLYRIRHEDLSARERATVTQDTIDVITRRIDPDGRMQIDVRPRGDFRFYIQLPGMGPEESRRIEDLIRRAGKLRFCLVNDKPEDRAKAEKGDAGMRATHTPFLPATRRLKDGRAIKWWRRASYRELAELPDDVADWLLVENLVQVSGEYLLAPHLTEDSTGRPAVGFSFRGRGAVLFEKTTLENQGRRLAIILDEDLYSAPLIETRIAGDGIIRGDFTEKQVQDLVSVLRAGQLPADIELEWNNTVGAQLGEDSIRAGIRASTIALILVVLFMAVYYLLSGVIADFAVTLNFLLVLGAMAAMQTVLTLPGIAGLVLILGMAVDANVLINERIREEQERGKTLRPAVRSGYERAFVTILDSNLTTLITALILFGVGTGPVRGFAMTLSLGIVLSMFSAVWVTRVIVDLLIEWGVLKRLHMLQIIRKPNIPFTRFRHLAMFLSLLAIILGLAVFFQRGDRKLDTDLTGGFRAEMELKRGIYIGEFRARVARLFPIADVQTVWDAAAAPTDAAPTRFSIRIRKLSTEQRMRKMQHDLTRLLRSAKLLASLTTDAPWQFTLHLAENRSETALRKALATIRYTDTDIREIIPLDRSATEFVIRARQSVLDPEKPDADFAKILDALESVIVNQSVRIRIGDLVEDKPASTRGRAEETLRGHIPIQLSAICSTVAVREAIVRDILNGKRPPDLRVVGHGADAGAEIARLVAVRGSAHDLNRIKASRKKELRVLSFAMPAFAELHISLKTPQTETALRDQLNEAHLLDKPDASKKAGLVRTVIPKGAGGKQFVLYMNPLSEDKAVESVQDALKQEFEAEVAAQSVAARLDPADPPSAPVTPEQLAKDKARAFKLTLDRALQIQEIQAALTRARQKDALLVGTIDAHLASRKEKEVYLKLTGTDREIEQTKTAIIFAFANPEPFRSIEAIGPKVAGEMKNKAVLAVILSWIAIIFYIWFRFGEVKFGIAAVVALIHDVLLTAGAVGVADALSGTAVGNLLGFSDIKINVTMIAAFLTLVGYSINDTIVVFDRIRENMGGVRRRVDAALINTSLNQILSRTILTSFTTFMALITLYIIGGPVIHGFAFVMAFGIIVGTYSSIFIASPILIGWETFIATLRKLGQIVTFKSG